jgi:hypothetical protein
MLGRLKVLPDFHIIFSWHALWGGAGWFDLPCPFSLYINDKPTPSHHVQLALYSDDRTIVATSRNPTLRDRYLESYLDDPQGWLSEWKIVKNVSKVTEKIFAMAVERFSSPDQYTFARANPIVRQNRYRGLTLDI